ncbi:insecticidal delta-endotoxin [Bacillus cereus group sp. IBL03679]|uniref:insecticidal delta-endotoxin n=1 Tax=Bacillus cereus group sp. IBL03679 TaxID=3240095 RepID=UPI003D2F6DD5
MSLWPTYDPTHYAVPTKSQFTRTVHSTAFGRPTDHTLAQVESNVIASPRLFTWLREMNIYTAPYIDLGWTIFRGIRTHYQYTLNNNIITGELQGTHGEGAPTNITIPSPQNNDDIRRIWTAQHVFGPIPPARMNVCDFQFEFAKSNPQTATTITSAYRHWSETVLPYIYKLN